MIGLNFIKDVNKNIGIISENKNPGKRRLISTYLRLRLKHLLCGRILRLKLHQEKIFGYRVSFFDYRTFIHLFEEIFIKQEYSCGIKTKKPFIIDCGSNIGAALIFFKKSFPDARIIAFEPDDKTFEKLKSNVESNNFQDVELVQAALSDHAGVIDFYFDPDLPGSLLMSSKKERLPKGRQKTASVLLSEFITQPVDFLKMDIEGAEGAVIEELAQKNKLKLIKEMCIEYHHHISPKDDNLAKILQTLEAEGFGYQISTDLHPPFEKNKFQDILIYAYKK